MDNVSRVLMQYENASTRLDQAIKDQNPVSSKQELANFESSFANLLQSRLWFTKEMMCTYWVFGFDRLIVLSWKILKERKWSNLFDDSIRVMMFYVQNIPVITESCLKRAISKRFRTLLGFLSTALTEENSTAPSISAYLKCLHKAFDAVFSTPFLLKDFYATNSTFCFGYVVAALLDVFESTAKDNEMRVHAGKCLLKIVSCNSEDAALMLSVVLPGTSSRLIKSTFSELHSEIICLALHIFTDMVVATLNDNVFLKIGDKVKNQKSDFDSDIIPKRDKEWISTTTKHLKDMIDNACSRFLLHADHKVRLSVLECVRNIEFQCHLAFCELIDGTFADVTVRLLLDPYTKIAEEAKQSLNKFSATSGRFLSERLRNRLFKLSDSLYYGANIDGESCKILNEISCIFNALGSDTIDCMIMIGGKPLRHLIFAIANSLAVDFNRLPVHVSDPTTLNATNELPLLHDIQPSDLCSICSCLADTENIHVIFEHLLEFVSIAQPKELVGLLILSNTLVHCIYQKLYPGFNAALTEILQLFIEWCVNHLRSLTIEEPAQDFYIKSEVNANDQTACLAALQLMLCGEAFSCLISFSKVRQVLMEALFEILQWTSSANKFCAAVAEKTLLIVAETMGKDISSLCVRYGGYMISRIAENSHGFSRESRAPLAICALMNHCNSSELFYDVNYITDLLLSAVDFSYQVSIIRVLRALFCVARAMQRWFKDVMPKNNYDQNEDSYEDDTDDSEDRKWKPEFVTLTIEIMKRTKHLLSSPHLPIRVLILDILEICICSLKNFYNEILPLLHQNWPGILCRLHDREVHVQLRAFEVIASMCAVSKSFLYRRFKEEAWPIIRNFMIKQSKTKCSEEFSYIHSYEFKYQKAVLTLSVEIWEGLEADESDKPLLIDVLQLYCNDSTPSQELREIALKSLEKCNCKRWERS